jgi:hypothetical protein
MRVLFFQNGTVNNPIYQKISNTIRLLYHYPLVQKIDPNTLNKSSIKKLVQKIEKSDVTVFETSSDSLLWGILILKSINLLKPTIILSMKNSQFDFLASLDNEKVIYQTYDEENLAIYLKSALDKAFEKTDKRFNFFISSDLLYFLENEAKKRKVTKSSFIRSLIINEMNKS